ncbi:MAG: transposase, partial [Balneolaceae bacterium]|nr:transposase [Balneolaceae bacterium]
MAPSPRAFRHNQYKEPILPIELVLLVSQVQCPSSSLVQDNQISKYTMEPIQSQDIHSRAVGSDVSAETLQARLGLSKSDRELSYSQSRRFPNSEDGYRQLTKWVRSKGATAAVLVCYGSDRRVFEQLAYWLHQAGRQVCVLVASRGLPLGPEPAVKSKTDQIDARLLARYGLERRPRRWQPSGQRLRDIKLLLRERQQLKNQRTQLKNRRHAARQSWDHPAVACGGWRAYRADQRVYHPDRPTVGGPVGVRSGPVRGDPACWTDYRVGPAERAEGRCRNQWVCPDSESQPAGLLRRTGCSSGPVGRPRGGGPYLEAGQCPPSAG